MSGTSVTRRMFAIAALLTAACAPETAQTTATDTAADEEAIRQLVAREVAAVNAGDAAGYLAIISSDFEAMPPNEPALVGPEAVNAWMTSFFSAVSLQAQYSNEQISVHGDAAIHRYAGELTATPKAGGAAMTEKIKGLHTFQRQADGSWKMTRDIWNNDAPMAPPPPATTAR